MSYEQFNQEIIRLVGGEDNITSVTHCVTRLRFNLKDQGIAKTEELRNLDGVIEVVPTEGSYQVIIGTQVSEVFEELIDMLNIDLSSDTTTEKKRGFKGLIQGMFTAIAETINPFLDVLMAAGMVGAVLSILTLVGVLSVESPTYIIFDSIKTGVFTFLPILIASSYAKRQNVNPYLAMALTFALVLPSIDGVEGLGLFGFKLQTITYTGSFIPALLGAWLLCVIVKYLNKVIPKNIQYFVVPALSLALTLPIVLVLFGPIGNVIGAGIGLVFDFLRETVGNWLALAFYAAVHPFLLITGAGSFTLPIVLNFVSELGYDPILLPGGFAADFAVTGAVIGCLIRARRDLKKNPTPEKQKEVELFGATGLSALLGVTEPALYGVFAKYRRPFIASTIGSVVGGLIMGLMGVKTYGFVWGLSSIPTYLSGGTLNFVGMLLGIGAAFTIGVVISYSLGFSKETEEQVEPVTNNEQTEHKLGKICISKVADGDTIPLNEVSDQAFASGALGKGIGIVPRDQETSIYSPISGKVVTVFPTKHAYGIRTENGVEVLIHIGIDTVNLEGQYFESLVKQDQQIKQGELLAKVDVEKVKAAGFDPTIIVVITNTRDFLDVIPAANNSDELLYVVL
ncbi:MAG: beta-glucoside-specific PTS transporter subunit IIABC [Enterococcus sp.]